MFRGTECVIPVILAAMVGVGCDGCRSSGPPVQSNNPNSDRPGASSAPSQKLNPELLGAFTLISERKTDDARAALEHYMSQHPSDGQAVFLYGLSFHREQRYGQALPHYEKALELAPNYYRPHHFRGWALYYLGDLETSRASFDAFLRAEPDEPDSLFALGLIDLDEDNLDAAEARFRRSIEVLTWKGGRDVKGLSKAHTRLGEVYERQDQLEKAKQELVRATDLFPNAYEAYYKLYRVLMRLGETEQAQTVQQLYLASKERVRPGTSFPE
ncbi:MAG: tetratricopeptide repeat protein [Phycisphaerales bacterium]|nr:tetratricopeptide repeat protein [Phycisphaerales bacterium]